MVKNILFSILLIALAFSVLFLSILRTAAVRYEFGEPPNALPKDTIDKSQVDYFLAYPGKVLPDSFLWPLKVLRDKIWFTITTDRGKKADLLLLFADKRLASAKLLFEKGEPEIAFATLEKSQQYLLEAGKKETDNYRNGLDTSGFSFRYANAALKHFEVMESILTMAPEDAKPKIIELQNIPKKEFEHARNDLLERGLLPPNNPFNWQ